jgi:hypothetical protein
MSTAYVYIPVRVVGGEMVPASRRAVGIALGRSAIRAMRSARAHFRSRAGCQWEEPLAEAAWAWSARRALRSDG